MTELTHPVVDKREEWDGPIPMPNGVTAEFWSATVDGRLPVQYCADCDTHQFYPRVHCTSCGQFDPEWVDSEGAGEIYTYTVNHVPASGAFSDYTPYVVAVVELTEGVRLVSMVDAEPEQVSIGDRVSVELWRVSEDAAVPVFTPAEDSTGERN